MKCIFPNYGEDCQYYCQCIKPKCHFSHGCLKKTATFNHHQISSMYKTRIVTLRALYLWFSFEYNKDLQKKKFNNFNRFDKIQYSNILTQIYNNRFVFKEDVLISSGYRRLFHMYPQTK